MKIYRHCFDFDKYFVLVKDNFDGTAYFYETDYWNTHLNYIKPDLMLKLYKWSAMREA